MTSSDLGSPHDRATDPPETTPPREGAEGAFQVGDVLSDVYELRAELGAGAMGQVFDAHDRFLNRRVAIKVAWRDVEARGPFLRKEGEALAAIRHPALVTVFAMGKHGGAEYMVMEHVPGITLESYMDGRKASGKAIALDEALDILISVADGLAAVHRAGIAHRDVKPGNIILAPGGRVVLTDFGLVLAEIDVAKTGDIVGTPIYMAPEAILREVEPGAGNLVDVYALGVLAFELLTGEPPYLGETLIATMRQHVGAPIPEVKGAPPRIAELVRELLAKDPRERPQQLESVVWRLRAVRAQFGQPSPDTPQSAFTALVVDDDASIAKLVGMYVRAAVPHAQVVLASSPKEAIDLASKHHPALMIMDLMMPEMNGIELYLYLKGARSTEKTTFLAMSAGAKEADVQLLRELGVSHFASKGPELRGKVTEVAKAARAQTA